MVVVFFDWRNFKMNDKNFLEELKQKRDEYGVTRIQIATACGITREYYNRIENGKLPLTDELKERLTSELERLNPRAIIYID